MKVTTAQAQILGDFLQKKGWQVWDCGDDLDEVSCCGQEYSENEKFCSNCGKKLVLVKRTDKDTLKVLVAGMNKALS